MELKICHLYPDLLNLYGDHGNVIALRRRCEARKIPVSVTGASFGERMDFMDYDLFFIGGGQNAEQAVLMDELHAWRGAEIRALIEDGKPLLAICGGYQLLGTACKTWDGNQMDCIGALDLYSVGGKKRMIGDYMFRWDEMTEQGAEVKIVGFENHSAKTYLGPSLRPFGTVLAGFGNNGEDKTEGARYKNVFGTYSHGPLLPKNPAVADYLIELALQRKYGSADLVPLDDTLENNARDFLIRRLMR